jgi:NAD(P)-dependent dehydrogenase (short-subunit alcohol dehydrogenase family)
MTVFRQGLLVGRVVTLADGAATPAIGDALVGLGARVLELDPGMDEDAAREWAASEAGLSALVYAATPGFGDGGQAALRESLERAWVATRGVAAGALIPAGAGKVVLIAPRTGAGRFAAAAGAAFENLARTLSVEWARYGVTAVAVAPGPATNDAELAELVCYLVSPAADYFDGCLFELGQS